MKSTYRDLWREVLSVMIAFISRQIDTFELAGMVDEWALACDELDIMKKEMFNLDRYWQYKHVLPKQYPLTQKWMDIENKRRAFMFDI